MLIPIRARRGWIMSLPLVLLVFFGTAMAQVIDGSISGSVKDSSGAYVPKASVTVTDAAIGVTRTTNTNSSGQFVVPALPSGTYKVRVSAQGFRELQRTNIPLANGDHVSAGEFVLAVGGGETTVTVEADQGQVQVQANSGERSDTLTSKNLTDLATNGRMILDYLKVIPGVVSTFNGAESSKGGLGGINVNGARGSSTGVTIDGITNVDNGCNCATQVTINPDAVSEMKVLTSNYQAEYGKVAGAQIAVATKNGTSQFHGNARWFHRNEGMNANEWFNDQANAIAEQQGKPDPNPKQKYRYNYFGFQFGGPVIIPKTGFNKNKDKLYFFFNQEYYRQLLPGGYDNTYVPTVDEINGNFSGSTDGYGKPITVVNPQTGQAFLGNKIPSTMINTAMQNYLLKVLPRPNATDNETCDGSILPNQACNHFNYITSKTTTHPRREDIGRLDYQINGANRLFLTVVNNDGHEFLPEGMSPQGISNFQFPGGMFLREPGYNVSTHLTSSISDTLVNEFTFGVNVNQQHIYSVNNLTNSNYNLNIPLLYPVAGDTAIPDMSFGGINGQSGTWSYLGSVPWRNGDTIINLSDNVTKILGRHTIKAGIFVERNRKDQSSWGNANGTFSFNTDTNNPIQTGNPYANALLGSFSSFQQQNGRQRGYYRYTNLEFFLQDNFKVTHRLTLDYGMRFAWVQPQYDAKDQVSYFSTSAWNPAQAVRLYKPDPDGSGRAWDSVTGTVLSNHNLVGTIIPGTGNPYNGMVSHGDAGWMQGGFQDRGLMLEPRVGFAYDLFGNGKAVLRGGFGMTHDRFQGNPIYNLVVGNPPLSADPSFTYGTVQNISALANSSVLAPASPIGFDPKGKVPTVYSYSLGIQHNLGWGTVLDVSYVGSQARHLSQKYNLNAIPYGTLFTRAAQDPSKYGNTGHVVTPETWGTAWVNAGYQFTGDNAYDSNFLRPYSGYGDIQYWTWNGDSNYNSLQVSARKHVSRGLTFTAAYTWSKAMGTSNSDGDWTNIIDPKVYNYTLASFDRPHNLAISYVYDLPKLGKRLNSKFLSAILDNYQLEGISQFITGTPGTVGANYTYPWGGDYKQMLNGSWTESVPLYVVGNPTAKSSNPYSHLNPDAFVMPKIGTPVPWSQNYFRNGGTNNFDMSLFKNIPLGKTESRFLQLGVEAYNVFNHPQFWGINTSTGKPNINGDTNPWNGMFFGSYSKAVPIDYSQVVRPAGKTGNIGQYFGEYNSGGNARILQLRMKLYF